MTTGSSCEHSQKVIPTEDLKGPSGGIYEALSGRPKRPFPQIPRLASLARDDRDSVRPRRRRAADEVGTTDEHLNSEGATTEDARPYAKGERRAGNRTRAQTRVRSM